VPRHLLPDLSQREALNLSGGCASQVVGDDLELKKRHSSDACLHLGIDRCLMLGLPGTKLLRRVGVLLAISDGVVVPTQIDQILGSVAFFVGHGWIRSRSPI